MSAHFNADEVFEMAEQIERNGGAFYTKAAEAVDHAAVAKLFRELAVWEHRHEKFFADLRAELTEKERGGAVLDPDDEMKAYLHAAVHGRVFNMNADPAAAVASCDTPGKALQLAIDREKDAVVFYAGIRAAMTPALGKDRIDGILAEELRHITILSDHLYRMPGE